jgi:eukaryotic-like serine/threonine-protein kinase
MGAAGNSDAETLADCPSSLTDDPSLAAGDGAARTVSAGGNEDWSDEPTVTAQEPGDNSAEDAVVTRDGLRPPEAPSGSFPTIPNYEILGELGRGGMGVVYHARSVRLNRDCALKMILAGAHSDAITRIRFLAEAEAVARLKHPNIVQIHHVGEADGLPYFELEYVVGGSLEKHLDGTPWPATRAAPLIEAMARGIAEAHRLGIVHRDLKPANVLIEGGETPKLSDFGLAKSLGMESNLTRSDSIMGSPSYMAPEQAEGKARQVGPPADIYALGAMLYELLSGRPPFRGATLLETLEQVKTAEPVQPSRLVPHIPRDVETIALRCLRKDPSRRYASAEALAEDLRRFLAGEPILARRSSGFERSWRWCRRNPALAFLWAALIVALVVGSATASFYAFRASQERDRALASAKEADDQRVLAAARAAEANKRAELLRRQDYVSRVNIAYHECLENNVSRALELLDGCPQDLRGWEWFYTERQCHRDLGTFHEPLKSVNGVAFNRDGSRIASVSGSFVYDPPGDTGDLVVRDAANGQEIFARRGVPGSFRTVSFSPDSLQIATGGATGLTLWDAVTGKEQLHQADPGGLPLLCLAYSPDGQTIIAGYGRRYSPPITGYARLLDARTGQAIGEVIAGKSDGVWAVAFSPDGREVALASEGIVEIWDLKTRAKSMSLPAHQSFIWAVAFSPDGRSLATGGWDRTIRLWERATGREIRVFHGHEGFVRGLAFSRDGRRIVSASEDKSVRSWDVGSGRQLIAHHGHRHFVMSVAYARDGRHVVSGGLDQAVKLWSASSDEQHTLSDHDGWVGGVAFSPDGRSLASGGGRQSTRAQLLVSNARSGQPSPGYPVGGSKVSAVAWSPDGRLIASAGWDGVVRIYQAEGGQLVRKLAQHPTAVGDVAWSPDGRLIASGGAVDSDPSRPGDLKLWEAETGREICTLGTPTEGVFGVAFSRDGRLLASADGPAIRIWDVDTGREVRTIRGLDHSVRRLLFLPDGKSLASSGGLVLTAGEVKVWDVDSGRLIHNLRGHTDLVRSLDVSRDGRRLVTGSDDRTLKLWDIATGLEVFTLRGHTSGVTCVSFDPDGRRIASGSIDRTIKIWDSESSTVEMPLQEGPDSR